MRTGKLGQLRRWVVKYGHIWAISPRWRSTRSSTRPTPSSPGAAGCAARSSRPPVPSSMRRVRALGRCPTGDAVATPGFRLPARFVVHTVGPVWRGGDHDEAALLRVPRTAASTEVARAAGARSLAFPAISTGIYGYPAGCRPPRSPCAPLKACAGDLEVTLVAFDAEPPSPGTTRYSADLLAGAIRVGRRRRRRPPPSRSEALFMQ